MKTLTYKGYLASVEYDAEDEILIGRIAGLNDVIGFHAESAPELKQAFRGAVDDYIATCAAVGKPPEKPYSGKLMVRIAPTVHASAALAAQVAGKSLAQWAEETLGQAARHAIDGAVAA